MKTPAQHPAIIMKTQIISQLTATVSTAIFVLLTSLSVSRAASGTWQGTVDDTWAGVNWSSSPVPGTGDTATFNNTGNGFTTIDLGAGVTIGNLLFDTAGASPYTIGLGAVGSQTLTLNDGGSVTMSPTVVSNQTLNASLILGTATAASYALTNNSATNILNLAGNIQGGTGGTAAAKTLVLDGTVTISGIVANGGASALGLQKVGGGTLTLTASNTFTGPISGIAGTLTIGGAGKLGGTTPGIYTGTIANNGVFNYNSSANSTNSGVISGLGGVTMNGVAGAVLTLGSATETYTGSTIVNSGTLALAGPNSANSAISACTNIVINSGGTIQVNSDNAFQGQISPTVAGPVTINNGGTLTVLAAADSGTGASSHIPGLLTLNGGTLAAPVTAVNAFANWGLYNGVVVNGGINTSLISACSVALAVTGGTVFNVANGGTVSGIDLNVTGGFDHTSDPDLGLIKTGSGTMALAGTNTMTSSITISNGTLIVNGAGNLGSGTYVGAMTNLATFIYNSSASQIFTGAITNAGTITVNSPTSVNFSGVISGTGSLTNNGSGTVTLYGANTYTGTTTINAGKLVVASAQPAASPVIVNDGGTLGVLPVGASHFSPSTLTLGSSAGATVQLALNSTTQAPLTPVTLNLTGNNTVNISAGSFVAGNNYPVLSYTTLTGGGSLSFTIPNGVVGTVTLSSQTYTLNVTAVTPDIWTGAVNGTWDINTTANWSSNGIAGVYVNGSPAQFDDTGLVTIITNLSATVVSPSTIVVNNSAKNYSFFTNIVITGGGGITKSGTFALTNRTANTYTGPTVINGGAVVAGVASVAGVSGAVGNNSAVSLANVAGATLNLNGFATQIGSLTGGGTTGGNVTNGGAALTVGGDDTSPAAFAGVITGSGGLTKIGTGTLTLTGTNTFTGTIGGIIGTLTIGGAGELSGAAPNLYAGTIANNGVFNYNSSANETNSAVISGIGALTVNGPGTLTLSTSPNTMSGATTINGGILQITSSSSGNGNLENSTITINSGGEMDLSANDSLGYAISLAVTNYGIIKKVNSQSETLFRPIYLSGGSLVTTLSGVEQFETFGNFIQALAGTANFVNGPGKFGLRTASCYLGVATGSTLTFNVVVDQNTAGAPLDIRGPGTVVLTAVNTFTGGITNGGTLQITSAGSLGSGAYAASITNNGAFIYGSTAAQTLSGPVSGTGTLQMNGSGATLTLSGTNTYTGSTLVSAGTLLLTGLGSISNTPSITVSNGAIFDVSGLTAPPFVLGASQSLLGSGVNNGSVSTTSGSKIYAGTDGSYGTNTFNNNLTLAAGATFNLDVGTAYNGPNDQVVVSQTLTANGNSIHLKAPSTLANLDTSGNDYLLISAVGGLTGTFNTTPIWDVRPANANHFFVTNDATLNQVRLHYILTAAPSIIASATPSTVVRNQSTFISATVTAGTGSITNVSVDLTSIGGVVVPLTLSATPNVYTNTVIIPAGAAPGNDSVTASATDTTPLTGTFGISLTVVATTETWNGGGGNQNWDTNPNWASTFAPGYAGDSLVFAGSFGLTPNMDNNYSVNGVTFSNNANGFNLGTSSSTLTLNGGLTNNSANVQILNVPVVLGVAVPVNAASDDITLGGVVSDSGTGLTKMGNHTLNLSGNNTFTGPVTVHEGTMAVSGTISPASASVISVSDTTGSNAFLNITASGTVNALDTAVGQFGSSLVLGKATNSVGVLNLVSGGALATAEQLGLGFGAGSYSAFEMSGGTATIGSYLVVGFDFDYAELDLSGGSITVNTNLMTIGAGNGSSVGVANISGGTFSAINDTTGNPTGIGGVFVGENGTGTLNVSGTALVNAYGQTNLTIGRDTGSFGTVNLLGGTISTWQVAKGLGSGLFNFNGGTLMAAAGWPGATTGGGSSFMFGLNGAYVYSGGAFIDDGGNSISLSQPLLAPAGYGVSSIGLTSGGAGYVAPPIITLSGGTGSGASAVATVAGGAVSAITVVNPGSGYSSSDILTVVFHGGGDSTVAVASTPVFAPNVSGGLTKLDTGTLTLTGANTYTNATTISNGTLGLGVGGSLNSAVINVAGGAYFDVSALSSYTVNSGQFLEGSGNVNCPSSGFVGTSSGSRIYPGTDGTAGLLSFNNGLTLASGATANFDLSTTYNGANDQISLGGTLTLNGNALHIKAPSTSVNLDTTADYVLITASSIAGSFASTPVWDVRPANAVDYTVETSGSSIILHYSLLAPPTGTASATPSSGVLRNQTILLSTTVTSSSSPITSVTVDTTPIGGSLVTLVQVGASSTYTNSAVIPAVTSPGAQTLTATITDNNSLTGTANIAFTVVTSTETWDGVGVNQNWDTNPNWASTFAPGYAGDSMVFAGSLGLAPNLDNNYNAVGLTFSNNASGFDIGTTSSTLTLNGGVTNNSANLQILNVPVVLGGAVTLAAAPGNLTLVQPVSEAVVGAGVLTTAGTGTTTLLGDNTYTGSTIINSGTLLIGIGGQLNNGAYAGAIANNGVLDYSNSSAPQTLTGTNYGTGGLTVDGGSQLTLGSGGVAPTAYTGPTIVNSGQLNLDFNNGNGSEGLSTSSGLTINNGGTVQLMVDNDLAGSVPALGSLPVTINTGGVLTGSGSADAGTGPSSHIRGKLTLNGGTLATGGSGIQLAYGSWDLDDGVVVPGNANTSTMSAPSMIPSEAGGTFFMVTNGGTASGIDLDVTGTLINGSSIPDTGIILGGNGTMALSGANTYAGSTTISNGATLILADPGVLGSGTYSSAIFNNGTFISQTTSGQILAGVVSGTGGLTVNSASATLTLSGASTYTGNTTITNGTLALASGGSIGDSANINVGSGAIFDVSAINFTLNPGQTLAGNGSVNGSVTNNGTVAPGTSGSIGTLTFNNNLTLNSGGVTSVKLNRTLAPAATNDLVVVSGALIYGGTLAVNVTGPLAVGNTFTLFNAGSESGVFSGITSSSSATFTFSPATGVLTVTSVVNTNAATANFKAVLAGGPGSQTLNFSWAADHRGWQLYTNSTSLTATGGWFPVPGSATVTSEVISINPAQPNVFFQLRYP
jgi:autotransporter-associated beta strand protein